MTALSIATWNINSARLRIDQVVRYLGEAQPDVLCLQEIKCREAQFPLGPLAEAGYPHAHVRGQKGLHGVAIVSRHPLEPLPEPAFCRAQEARAAVARVNGVEVHTYYVPSGGDEPDPDANPKFAHKLDFLARMAEGFAGDRARLDATPVIVTGDLNVAPLEHDVWSHKQMLKVVSHTPVETEGLTAAQTAGGFVDLARVAVPESEKLYTWWSYRARDWRASNRGRRLDHIWASSAIADQAAAGAREAFAVHDHTRDWEKPSDHAPVLVRFQT